MPVRNFTNHFVLGLEFFLQYVERFVVPQQPNFSIAEHNALARSVGQFQSQIGDLEVDLPLFLLSFDAFGVDVKHHLFLAQFAEQVQELGFHGTEMQEK